MLGKGLESLIPNKNPQNQGDNFSQDDYSAPAHYGVSSEEEIVGADSFERPGMYAYARSQYSVAPVIPSQPEDRDVPVMEPSESVPVLDTTIPAGEERHQLSGPIFQIEVGNIVLNPYQPRKNFDEESLRGLAASIRELGILQPLVVTKEEIETEFGTKVRYQLIAGQRRLMASKLLGLKTVPAIIRRPERTVEALEMAIVENIQRADLSIIETARAYARLSDEFGLTQREIAVRMGKSRESVANALRLLSLPTVVQDAINQGDLSESHARILLQIEDAHHQEQLFDQIKNEQLSVRELKRRLSGGGSVSSPAPRPVGVVAPVSSDTMEMKALEATLSEFLGAPVKVDFSSHGGKIVIHFYSPEEAQGIVRKIRPHHDDY